MGNSMNARELSLSMLIDILEENAKEDIEDLDEEIDAETHVEQDKDSNQYMYLKGLLKSKGYAFSTNDLVYQDYIT
jgi:hypothetical protein